MWVDERIEYGERRLIALTPKQLKDMVPLRTLRGRPQSDNKKLLVSVRYSPEVVAYFKSTGEGWRSRMDSVLRDYVPSLVRNAMKPGISRLCIPRQQRRAGHGNEPRHSVPLKRLLFEACGADRYPACHRSEQHHWESDVPRRPTRASTPCSPSQPKERGS